MHNCAENQQASTTFYDIFASVFSRLL